MKADNNSVKRRKPNLDLSTWRAQIEKAIADGHSPEPCVWGNVLTPEEEKEWTW